jgi:hypothetical protein
MATAIITSAAVSISVFLGLEQFCGAKITQMAETAKRFREFFVKGRGLGLCLPPPPQFSF